MSSRNAFRGSGITTLTLTLVGCVLPPVDLSDRACPCIEGWVCDAVRDRCVPADFVPDAGPGGEACNGHDDDGDERVDEGTDLCGVVAHGQAQCVEGACVLTCSAGFADCDGVLADGCEASLGDAASCGACGVRCAPPSDLCLERAGAHVCAGACDEGQVRCGSSCVDVRTSLLHCGACDQACAVRLGVESSCVAGACRYDCLEDRADCDGDGTSCETDIATTSACGACDVSCATEHNTAVCEAGACLVTGCEDGWDDCDADPRTGCETSLRTTDHCGACGTACVFANATARCEASGCARGACDDGFADCNGAPGDGCETDLASVTSCGACGVTCTAGEVCDASAGCAAPDDVVEVSAGDDFACARLQDGRVFCWGADDSGQLGNGAAGASATAVAVAGVSDAIDVDAGARHACAVRRSGNIVCWGENEHRQLGAGSGPPHDRPEPVPVASLSDAVRVAAGRDHTCALRTGGGVVCWGRNDRGQLGDGSTSDRSSPVSARSLGGARDLAAGDRHTCALRETGQIVCWGDNSQGALGDGTTMQRSSPAAVSGIDDARSISAGSAFTCAVLESREVRCWGDNALGQLGDETTIGRTTPAQTRVSQAAAAVACGGQHACARLDDGSVECWGAGAAGQLGNGVGDSAMPKPVSALLDGVGITAGASHTCAVRDDGTASCWGAGGSGRLGDGDTIDRSAPVAVAGLP